MSVGNLRKATVASIVMAALLGVGHPAGALTTYKTTAVSSAGISLKVPRSWTTLSRDPKALAAQQRQLAKHNPKVALNAAQQAEFLRSAKFRAVDDHAALAGRFASNVSVQVTEQGGFPASLDEFTTDARQEYASQGVTLVAATSVPVSGATGYRADTTATVSLPDARVVETRVSQLFLPRNAGSVTITVATTNDAAGAKLIGDILGSVRRI